MGFHGLLDSSSGAARSGRAPEDLAAAGIERGPEVTGVRDGHPLLADGRVLDVTNVIWCTGYRPDYSRIHLPVLGDTEPLHHRGIVASEPGLYFVGRFFLYAMSSRFLRGSAETQNMSSSTPRPGTDVTFPRPIWCPRPFEPGKPSPSDLSPNGWRGAIQRRRLPRRHT
jgi:hypothetical protein